MLLVLANLSYVWHSAWRGNWRENRWDNTFLKFLSFIPSFFATILLLLLFVGCCLLLLLFVIVTERVSFPIYPVLKGGGAGRVIFIDTEGSFRSERVKAVAERFQLDAGMDNSLLFLPFFSSFSFLSTLFCFVFIRIFALALRSSSFYLLRSYPSLFLLPPPFFLVHLSWRSISLSLLDDTNCTMFDRGSAEKYCLYALLHHRSAATCNLARLCFHVRAG